MGDQAAQPREPHRVSAGPGGRDAVAAHVLAAVPHLPRDAAAQQTVHGRLVALDWGPQPHRLQHAVRAQDPHDHLSRDSAARVHGLAVDHRIVDAQAVREVTEYSLR